MEPICHTLVGASLGCSGLENRTRFGRATLIVAANLPDIDVLSYLLGDVAPYAFRRGLTHGLPALVVLPFLLAPLMLALDALFPARDGPRRASLRWLLILSAVGVATHPALDWLNNYGMRWLMPFVDRWFYGDTLFIVDWIAWLVLGAGLVASRCVDYERLAWYSRPAAVSIGVLLAYIAMNFAITQAAERAALAATAADPPARLMASPVPLDPLTRDIVFDYGDVYRFGTYRFGVEPAFAWKDRVVPHGNPVSFEMAASRQEGHWFLHWARFPYIVTDMNDGAIRLRIADARYVPDIERPALRGFGRLTLEFAH